MEIRKIIDILNSTISPAEEGEFNEAKKTLENMYKDIIISFGRALNDASPISKYTINDGKLAIKKINNIAQKHGVSEIKFETPGDVLNLINDYGSSFLS